MKRRKAPKLPGGGADPSCSSGQPGAEAKSNAEGPIALGSIAAVSLLCCASYCNTWGNAFSFDDNFAVVNNPDVTGDVADLRTLLTHDFWGRDISEGLSHKSWRPLTTLTFRWNYLAAGLSVGPYHAVNLALHTAVSLAFLALVHRTSGVSPHNATADCV